MGIITNSYICLIGFPKDEHRKGEEPMLRDNIWKFPWITANPDPRIKKHIKSKARYIKNNACVTGNLKNNETLNTAESYEGQ